ncbi:hypothetical protein [Frankia sp. B2]|uniref:hypothetical protein n=1 Tax=Frankia sp. B2 TaxID=2541730 RepID=UPI00141BA65B|nr:hypothetical protein [Frankia sp. B2]
MNPPPLRHRVTIRPHTQTAHPYTPVAFALPYLPDTCPDEVDWPARDGHYPGPHQSTVCPTCLHDHQRHATVSDPHRVAADTPMIYALDAPTPTGRGEHPLLAMLRDAGFTRLAWLPLPGLDDPEVLVADNPARGSRATLHPGGLDLHLTDPDSPARVHIRIGPHVDPTAVLAALHATGHPLTRPAPTVPALPPGARLLTANDAIHMITVGGHAAGQHPDLAVDVTLIDALRAGLILAALMPDGRLAFTPNPHHTRT